MISTTTTYQNNEMATLPTVFWRSPLKLTAIALGFAVWIFLLQRVGLFDIWDMIDGSFRLAWIIWLMLPPWPGPELQLFLASLLETLSMAFLGTFFAALIAIPLGLLMARNIVPFYWVRWSVRGVFNILRGVDNLIFALIFVSAVGLGPFAGVLALMIGTIGSLGKLVGEAVENVDQRQIEGIKASGANHLEIIRFGIAPQILPVVASLILYYFESNTRSATILGVVGAGGIGLQLTDRIRIQNWQEVGFLILLIVLTATVIDILSGRIRKTLIG